MGVEGLLGEEAQLYYFTDIAMHMLAITTGNGLYSILIVSHNMILQLWVL